MKLPNFIISGFPKCGSTSLYYYLAEHPEIYMPKQKELHYFTYKTLSLAINGPGDKEVNKFHVKNFNDYIKCYLDVTNEKAIGDASPSYINYASCIPSIKKKLGNNIKVIILLRDPIKRAYSNYLHLVREHRERLDFFSAIEQEEQRKENDYSDFWHYTFNSFYYDKIKAFKKEFKDVLIITSEELSNNTLETVQRVYDFLEVDTNFSPENINRRYNPGGVYENNFVTRFVFKQGKMRSFIKQLFPITPWMKHLKHKIISKHKKATPKVDKKTEEYLVNLFREDVIKVESNYKINIEYWNSGFSTSNNLL